MDKEGEEEERNPLCLLENSDNRTFLTLII